MAAPKITLYLDIVSPFAYMGYYVLKHSPVFAKCDVTYVPVFLGAIMKACNNIPPIRINNKDKWINAERQRLSRQFGIPMVEKIPEEFPPSTLAVQRALSSISSLAPQKLGACFGELYRSFWAEGNNEVIKPEGFEPVLERVLGKDVAIEVIKHSTTPEGKALLAANTDRALESGAFGLPWFECTGSRGQTESFWGIDRLGQVVAFLGLDASSDNGFRAMI